MGLRPPRRRRRYRKRIHYATMKRVRFRRVRQPAYLMQCWVRLLHEMSSLNCDSQRHDDALKRLATSVESPEPDALEQDEPKDLPDVSVDELLHRIDPITWYRWMKLCENILQGRRNPIQVQVLVNQADLSREKLDRPTVWSPSHTQGRAYLSEGIADEQEVPIILDTGASFSLSPFKSDFVKEPHSSEVKELTGISDTVKVEGIGVVEWPIVDIFGRHKILRTHAYYVPQADIRLFSPQTYLQEHPDSKGKCVVTYSHVTLTTADGIVSCNFPTTTTVISPSC